MRELEVGIGHELVPHECEGDGVVSYELSCLRFLPFRGLLVNVVVVAIVGNNTTMVLPCVLYRV